jgi:hypothetical protein
MASHEDVVRGLRGSMALLEAGSPLPWEEPHLAAAALKLLLHCADIGNSTKPPPYCTQWAERVMEGGLPLLLGWSCEVVG